VQELSNAQQQPWTTQAENNDVSDMPWRTRLECQCTSKSTPFQCCFVQRSNLHKSWRPKLLLVTTTYFITRRYKCFWKRRGNKFCAMHAPASPGPSKIWCAFVLKEKTRRMEGYCFRQTIMAPGHVMMINCYPRAAVAAANHSWAECNHWTKIIIARRPSLTNIFVLQTQ
jgi:hypothetical protein